MSYLGEVLDRDSYEFKHIVRVTIAGAQRHGEELAEVLKRKGVQASVGMIEGRPDELRICFVEHASRVETVGLRRVGLFSHVLARESNHSNDMDWNLRKIREAWGEVFHAMPDDYEIEAVW